MRKPDDFQPRSNLKKLFSEGKISCNDNDATDMVIRKFIVPTDIVHKYVVHMGTLKNDRQKRTIEKQQNKKSEEEKGYEDYDGIKMIV